MLFHLEASEDNGDIQIIDNTIHHMFDWIGLDMVHLELEWHWVWHSNKTIRLRPLFCIVFLILELVDIDFM